MHQLPLHTLRIVGWVAFIQHRSAGLEPITIDTLAAMLRVPAADLVPALHFAIKRNLLGVNADGRLFRPVEIASRGVAA